MCSPFAHGYQRILSLAVALTALAGFASGTLAQDKLAEPIYRVANDTPAAQSAATTQTTAPAGTNAAAGVAQAAVAAAAGAAGFDLTQKPGEHPLMPVLRTLKTTQEEIDHNVRDYSCTLVKQERVNGELGESQHIMMKVMNQPFSVYMSFLKPFAGREVLYVAGQNDGKLMVQETGFTRMLGKISLDPNGTRAMTGQRHPITDVGMRNLTAKLLKMWDAETKFAEAEVTSNSDPKIKVAGRSPTMIQVVHPIPRQDFKFHVARLFIDNELKVPIHFDAYLWPEQAGGEPTLEESYTYTNLKINNGFTARDFDAANPEIFK